MLSRRGGIGFLGAFGGFAQNPCGQGVCGDWVDIDSPWKRPVELGRLARMACTEAGRGTDFSFPFFPHLSGILAGPGSKHPSASGARSAKSASVRVNWLSVPGKEA